MTFDPDRAWLRGPDYFRRFRIEGDGAPLKNAGLRPDWELLVAERDGAKAAFLMHELAYPHGGQGVLAGQPYLVSF